MRGCRIGCLHRLMVEEYRDARYTYEQEVEEASIGYETEAAEYRERVPGITFKQWLIGKAGERVRSQQADGTSEGSAAG